MEIWSRLVHFLIFIYLLKYFVNPIYVYIITENVFSIKSWCKNKFGFMDSDIDKQFNIPDDFDYLDWSMICCSYIVMIVILITCYVHFLWKKVSYNLTCHITRGVILKVIMPLCKKQGLAMRDYHTLCVINVIARIFKYSKQVGGVYIVTIHTNMKLKITPALLQNICTYLFLVEKEGVS